MFVERATPTPNGQPRVSLEPPAVVTPGDQLVFVLSYRNNGAAPASDFTVTNPLPDSVASPAQKVPERFIPSTAAAIGARSPRSTVRDADGSSRPAALADVTQRPLAARSADPGRRRRRIEIQRHCKIGLEPAERRQRGWKRRRQLY